MACESSDKFIYQVKQGLKVVDFEYDITEALAELVAVERLLKNLILHLYDVITLFQGRSIPCVKSCHQN